jgi:hypothetical protein
VLLYIILSLCGFVVSLGWWKLAGRSVDASFFKVLSVIWGSTLLIGLAMAFLGAGTIT